LIESHERLGAVFSPPPVLRGRVREGVCGGTFTI
jgi:hypothetical protein